MEVSANVRRTEPTPRREQDGETYSAATRSRSTSTQPIAAPSTATHTSCSRIARATRSAAPRVAHLSACSLDIAGTASARMARRRILASASSSAASARRICIKSLPRSLTHGLAAAASNASRGRLQQEVRRIYPAGGPSGNLCDCDVQPAGDHTASPRKTTVKFIPSFSRRPDDHRWNGSFFLCASNASRSRYAS